MINSIMTLGINIIIMVAPNKHNLLQNLKATKKPSTNTTQITSIIISRHEDINFSYSHKISPITHV